MTLPEIQKALKSLVVKDISTALTALDSVINSDSSYYNFVILKQSSYNSLKKDKLSGTLADDKINLRENQIRNSVLETISMLELEDIDTTAAGTILKPKVEKPKPVEPEASPEVSKNAPPADSKKSGIYISYAWGEEREEIVNALYDQLTSRGLNIIRDKVDMGYKGSIVEFMNDIGKANKIIVVISEKYMKSPNCMYELVQIYESDDFADRIFPVVLRDANIYDPLSRVKYIKYWDEKINELNEGIKSIAIGTDLLELQQELTNYGRIRALFSKMSFILKDMNTLKPEMHKEKNFQILYDYLTK